MTQPGHQTTAGDDAAPIIRVRGLVFRRGRKTILDGIDLDIPRGAMVAFMGPSGAGKTTMLQLISGQLHPDEGWIEVNGQRVSDMSDRELYRFRRNIGVLLQNGALFTDLTVFENIATPVREHTDLPEPLSGGMARRVALARAVVLDPSLMLYDEPLTGLDPIAVSQVRVLMRETNAALGLTSIIVSHNVAEMRKLTDYVYIIASARIAGQGTPDELSRSSDPGVDQFVNGKVEGPIPFHYEGADASWNLLS
jgi:phospholipid/cholesterol/gamma-HCH transport system ATP-binding protein